MIAHQLIEAGNNNVKSSLKEIASKYLDIDLNKDEQVSDWKSDKLTDSQLKYGALDAKILLSLRKRLIDSLKKWNLIRVAKIEFDCVVAVAMMEYNGMLLDLAKWQDILKNAELKKKELAIELQELLPPEEGLLFKMDINLDSPKQ